MLKKLVLPLNKNTRKDKLSMTAEMLQLMTEDIINRENCEYKEHGII